jgi:hypothetical protein
MKVYVLERDMGEGMSIQGMYLTEQDAELARLEALKPYTIGNMQYTDNYEDYTISEHEVK